MEQLFPVHVSTTWWWGFPLGFGDGCLPPKVGYPLQWVGGPGEIDCLSWRPTQQPLGAVCLVLIAFSDMLTGKNIWIQRVNNMSAVFFMNWWGYELYSFPCVAREGFFGSWWFSTIYLCRPFILWTATIYIQADRLSRWFEEMHGISIQHICTVFNLWGFPEIDQLASPQLRKAVKYGSWGVMQGKTSLGIHSSYTGARHFFCVFPPFSM